MLMNEDENKYLEILRKIPIEKKLKSAFELYEFARNRIIAEIQRRNPTIAETDLKKMIQERFHSK
jgi:hypothetical protein